MALSSAAFTTLPDGFTDRSNARHRPPERHSSVQGCASKRPFLAPNAGGTIRKMKPDMTWQTRGKDRRNPHPPRYFDPRCAAQAQTGHARKTTVMLPTATVTAIPIPLLATPNCSKRGAFHGCNSEPPTARECRQKRHGMEARRAETAKRVRFTTARRAGLVPARAPSYPQNQEECGGIHNFELR